MLSEKAIKEFQKLFKEIYKKEISMEIAEVQATNLIKLVYLVANENGNDEKGKQQPNNK